MLKLLEEVGVVLAGEVRDFDVFGDPVDAVARGTLIDDTLKFGLIECESCGQDCRKDEAGTEKGTNRANHDEKSFWCDERFGMESPRPHSPMGRQRIARVNPVSV